MAMEAEPVLVDLGPDNVGRLPCCGVKNPEHAGRQRKVQWCGAQWKHGLRAKVLMTPDQRQCGYIEYIPGEHAWRGVKAAGYLFVHCLWTIYRKYQRKGVAGTMLRACVEEACEKGMNGVAVVAREGPWLAGTAVFLRNGFKVVAQAPPDYQLLALKLKPSAPDPEFAVQKPRPPARYGNGLVIVRAGQCPHAVKFAEEIAEAAREVYHLRPKIVELRSYREAQNAPTPYATFAIFWRGRLIADHPISRTRFHNIMKKAGEPETRRRARA